MGHPSGRRCLRGWPTPFVFLKPWYLSIPVLWLVLAGLHTQAVGAEENIYEQDVEFFRSINGISVRCMGKIKYTMGKNTAGTLDKFECHPARERTIPLSSASVSDDFSCDKVKPAPWWPPSWDSLVPGCRNGGSSSSSSLSISSLSVYSSSANCLCSPLSSSSTTSSSSFSSSYSGSSSSSSSSSSHECLCVSLSSSSYSSMSAVSSCSSASQCICSSLSSSLSSSIGSSSAISSSSSAPQCICSSLSSSLSSSIRCSVSSSSSSLERSLSSSSSSSELNCICSSLSSSSSMSVSSLSSSFHECLCSSSSIYSSISSSRSSSCSSQPNCICSSISSSSMSISSSSSSSSSLRYSSCSSQLDCICSSTSVSSLSSACSSSSSYFSNRSQMKKRCENIFLSKERVIADVSSPNYPSTYLPNFHCTFNITAPLNKKVVVFFEDLRVEYKKNCTCDYIKLTHLNGHYGIKMCGTRVPPPWMNFVSRENFITVEFKSNHALNARGFKMKAITN